MHIEKIEAAKEAFQLASSLRRAFIPSEKLLPSAFTYSTRKTMTLTDPPKTKNFETRKMVTLGLIQASVSEDIAANMKKTIEKIKQAAEKGVQIVCLQELYRTRYFPQEENQDAAELAEMIPGESTVALAEVAKEKKIVIIAPVFEKASNGIFFNTAVVIDADGKILAATVRCMCRMTRFSMSKTISRQAKATLCTRPATARLGF